MLHAAHFQLTRRCNLSCCFCGQSKGMLHTREEGLGLSDWLRVAAELKMEAERGGLRPSVMLWGGEPLLSTAFDELAERLSLGGFQLSVVTNGTLIPAHVDVLNRCMDTIHVSLDGGRETHDSVRGAGVFDRVARNLELLRERRGKLVFLCTVSDANVEQMAELPEQLLPLKPDRIVLQPLMYLSAAEIEEYRAFSCKHFGADYPELAAWRRDDDDGYRRSLAAGVAALKCKKFPVPVDFTAHAGLGDAGAKPCRAPWTRLHVRCDGEVGFCTDYFGFSAGNIWKMSLRQIFSSSAAETFRRAVEHGSLPSCRHCPWRLQVL